MSKEQEKYDYKMEQITKLFIEHNWHNKRWLSTLVDIENGI